jgi:hypothetical protein
MTLYVQVGHGRRVYALNDFVLSRTRDEDAGDPHLPSVFSERFRGWHRVTRLGLLQGDRSNDPISICARNTHHLHTDRSSVHFGVGFEASPATEDCSAAVVRPLGVTVHDRMRSPKPTSADSQNHISISRQRASAKYAPPNEPSPGPKASTRPISGGSQRGTWFSATLTRDSDGTVLARGVRMGNCEEARAPLARVTGRGSAGQRQTPTCSRLRQGSFRLPLEGRLASTCRAYLPAFIILDACGRS